MYRAILAAVLATTCFGAVAATAQTAPRPRSDSDRVIPRADALAEADRRFDRMDVNKDGKLTPEEMRQGRGPGAPGSSASPEAINAMAARRFAQLDTNGDGVVDREEFRAQAARRFDMIDTNKDGVIDAAERQAARAAMGDRMGAMRGRRADGVGGDMPPPAPAHKPNAEQ